MAKPRPIFPPINEEIARIKWFEAFMRGRVELEQKTISGLQELLEGAPPFPERKLLWHHALEKLLDGTREELDIRMEELQGLKDQMEAMGMSIAEAEMGIPDLKLEITNLQSTDSVDSAQAATATSHKDWFDIKSVDVSTDVNTPKGLSSLLFLGRAQKQRKTEKAMKDQILKAETAYLEYYEQDLTYRRTVYQQRQSREQFLGSIPDRIQEYGTKYWTAVRDLGMAMESFANYLRNISSICSSSGSALWASAKNIKPLVDANCHTEAIEVAYHQSPIRFTPLYYRNPGFKSSSPTGQTILFGCPLALCTVGELKKIPPVLEYLLDPDHDWDLNNTISSYATWDTWHFLNEIERAWTGVEKSNRAFISKLVQQGHLRFLIAAYFTAIPKPVLSDEDIVDVQSSSYEAASLIWKTWSQDPIKTAVIQAILSYWSRSRDRDFHFRFSEFISGALGQNSNTTEIVYLLHILYIYKKSLGVTS